MSDDVPVEVVIGNDARTAEMRWMMMPGAPELPRIEDLIHRPAWMSRGACRGEPHATFFLGLGGSPKRARALCATCPARDECLAYALADAELVGIWGGTSAKERDAVRTGRPAA